MHRYLIILVVILFSCNSTKELNDAHIIAEQNKDVAILCLLIQDQLRKTDERNIDLNEIVAQDSLKRIIQNFEKIEWKSKASRIAFYYKFSKSRQNITELSSRELHLLSLNKKWKSKNFTKDYDGEIQFNFGERFYNVRKIVVKK